MPRCLYRPGGQQLAEGEGQYFSYRAGDETYVRFEGLGDSGRIFLQPLWQRSDNQRTERASYHPFKAKLVYPRVVEVNSRKANNRPNGQE